VRPAVERPGLGGLGLDQSFQTPRSR
jgi:hypothetical protein